MLHSSEKTFIHAPSQGGIWDVEFARPFHHRLSFVAVFNFAYRTAIVLLLSFCGPMAIVRIVAKIIIFTIQTMLGRRALPHIHKKGFKGYIPSFANGDVPSAVIGKRLTSRILASGAHRNPSTIFRFIGATVGQFHRAENIFISAATTPRCTRCQGSAATNKPFAAFAETCPVGDLVYIASRETKDGHAIESLSSQVTKETANRPVKVSDNIDISHDVFSLLENRLVRVVGAFDSLLRPVFILPRYQGTYIYGF